MKRTIMTASFLLAALAFSPNSFAGGGPESQYTKVSTDTFAISYDGDRNVTNLGIQDVRYFPYFGDNEQWRANGIDFIFARGRDALDDIILFDDPAGNQWAINVEVASRSDLEDVAASVRFRNNMGRLYVPEEGDTAERTERVTVSVPRVRNYNMRYDDTAKTRSLGVQDIRYYPNFGENEPYRANNISFTFAIEENGEDLIFFDDPDGNQWAISVEGVNTELDLERVANSVDFIRR